MKWFTKSYDGGPNSGVTGYWLLEWKKGISIVLLHFSPGSREAFHSHAFNAFTWWLRGSVIEEHVNWEVKTWKPSLIPKWTPRNCYHKIIASSRGAWALSIRGPWSDTWKETKGDKEITLTHGRKIVE